METHIQPPQHQAQEPQYRKQHSDQAQNPTGKATAGLVLGIVGLIAWFIPLFGLPINVVGIVLSTKGLKSACRGRAVAGLTMSIIGLVMSVISSFYGFYIFTTKQSSAVATPSTIASIPETQVQIPAPIGFVEGSRLSDILKKRGLLGEPPSVKLLGVYCPPDVLAAVLNQGNEAPSIPFCMAKLRKTYPSIAEANEGFQKRVVSLKKDMPTDMDDPGVRKTLEHFENAARKLSPEHPVKIEGFVPLGVMIDRETVFAFSMLVNISGSEGNVPLASASANVLVGTQHVEVTVCYVFTGQADIETAKRVLLQWVSEIQRLNGL
jgi:hypothetical protein